MKEGKQEERDERQTVIQGGGVAYRPVKTGRRRGNVQEKEKGKTEETIIIKRWKWIVKRTTKRGIILQ